MAMIHPTLSSEDLIEILSYNVHDSEKKSCLDYECNSDQNNLDNKAHAQTEFYEYKLNYSCDNNILTKENTKIFKFSPGELHIKDKEKTNWEIFTLFPLIKKNHINSGYSRLAYQLALILDLLGEVSIDSAFQILTTRSTDSRSKILGGYENTISDPSLYPIKAVLEQQLWVTVGGLAIGLTFKWGLNLEQTS
jgi:hypothetical protein